MKSVFKCNPLYEDNHVHHNEVALRVSEGIKMLGTARSQAFGKESMMDLGEGKRGNESMMVKKTNNRKQ